MGYVATYLQVSMRNEYERNLSDLCRKGLGEEKEEVDKAYMIGLKQLQEMNE